MFRNCSSLAALLGLLAAAATSALAAPPSWLRVSGPHFTVVTDGSADQGRDIAGQLERLRSALMEIVPGLQDPAQPLDVMAVKKRQEFLAIIPLDDQGKGKPDYGSYSIWEPERNLILLRLDSVDDSGEQYPFFLVYTSYVRILLGQSPTRLPDWLQIGLSRFYGTAHIHDKQAEVGQANQADLDLLYHNRHLTLDEILSANVHDAEWQNPNRLDLFDAEAWALVHMLLVGNGSQPSNRIGLYLDALQQHLDPEAAFAQAFGDKATLQRQLDAYTHQLTYHLMAEPVSTKTNPQTYPAASMDGVEADALRAEFMIGCQRYTDAREILDGVLKTQPTNTYAMESMGLLESRQNNLDTARQWYAKAAAIDTGNYLVQYRYASLSLQGSTAAADPAVETALRASIRDNPNFAPALDALAGVLISRRSGPNEAEAAALEQQAIKLQPSEYRYRYDYAMVLENAQKFDAAIPAAQTALAFATTPQQTTSANLMLQNLQSYQQQQAAAAAANAQIAQMNQEIAAHNAALVAQEQADNTRAAATDATITAPAPAAGSHLVTSDPHPVGPPTGPTKVVSGVIQTVFCTGSNGMDIALEQPQTSVVVHSDDYFQVKFSADFTVKGTLLPCTQIEGLHAVIHYVPGSDPESLGDIVSVVLSKTGH